MSDETNPPIVRTPRKEVPVFQNPKAKPVDRILTEDQLTPYEREMLAKKFGYTDGPVPSNLPAMLPDAPISEAMQRAVDAAVNAPVEGFSLPTKNLDTSNIPTVRDDAKVAEAFAAVTAKMGAMWPPSGTAPTVAAPVKSAFEQARSAGIADIQKSQSQASMHPDIAKALEGLDREIQSQPGELPRHEETEEEIQARKDEEAAEKRDVMYERLCNAIEPEDADNYRESVYTLSRFEKTYELFGGNLLVTFGNYGADEDTMVIMQESIDARLGRIDRADLASLLANSARYTFTASLRSVKIVDRGVLPVSIPESMSLAEFLATLPRDSMTGLTGFESEDTNIRMWYRFLVSKALPGSLYRVIFKKYEEFRMTLTAVEKLAQYPRFFVPPTQPS